MNIKKTLKISGLVFLVIIVIIAIFIAIYYYQYWGKYEVNNKKYPSYVGLIDSNTATQITNDYKLCGKGILYGYYHSAAPKIYKGNKKQFREFIFSNFQKEKFSENGYLNLRFHINCKGQVGNLEINELNDDFARVSFSSELVDHIIELIGSPDNWETYEGGDYNYYMNLNFKLENGEITEIIP